MVSAQASRASGPGRGQQELASALKPLLEGRLVLEDSPDTLIFRHTLTREAVYGTLLARQQRALHREVAEALERIYTETRESLAPDLAYHYYAAGEWERAAVYARQAGEAAQSKYAPREAIAFFTRAIDATGRAEAKPLATLYRARGQAYETLGEFERARVDHERALELAHTARDPREEWQALLDLGFMWAARDYGRTGVYFEQALQVARTLDEPALLARTLNRVGNWHLNRVQLSLALERHQEALTIFETLKDRRGLAETFDLLGLTYLELDDWNKSGEYYRQAIALFRALDDRQGLGSSLAVYAERAWGFAVNLGVVPFETPGQAIADAQESLSLAREIGWRSGEAFALGTLGGIYGSHGDYGRGLALARAGLEIAQAIEHYQWRAFAHHNLGWLYAEITAWDAAQTHLEHALALGDQVQSSLIIGFATGVLTLVYLQQKDFARAQATAERAFGGAAGLRAFVHGEQADTELTVAHRMCLTAYAELSIARGEFEQALAISQRLLDSTPNLTADTVLPLIWFLRGSSLIGLQRYDAAAGALEAALAEALRRGKRSQLWRIHAALGALCRARGRPTEAEREISTARATVQELAETIPEPPLRAQFLERATAQIDAQAR